MKHLKRLLSWLHDHLSYVQASLTFLVTIIAAISGIYENYLALIVTLLVFVGTEFTIITIGYLEQILKALKNQNENSEIDEVIVNDSQKWTDLAQKARHDLFLSGVTMGSLYQERRLLSDIPDNININILVHNPNNRSVTELYYEVFKPKASINNLLSKQELFKSLATDLAVRNNVHIKMTDDPLYMQFVACDIFNESDYSYIRTQHCLRKYLSLTDIPKVDDKLIYGVKKGSSVYEVYQRQILKLWDTATIYNIQEDLDENPNN